MSRTCSTCDGDIFFEEYGLALVANLYNLSAKRHGGRCEAIFTSKKPEDCEIGTCVQDWERGVAGGIPANPWQTDTSVGDWHYDKADLEQQVQDAQARDRHAGRYRQPQRQPDAEFFAAQ